MNWIVDLSLRNLKRNRRRTIFAALSICLSVMLMTFMGGLIAGILDNFVKNVTKNDSGHIRVTTAEFDERSRFTPVDANIADPGAVVAAIEAIPELKGKISLVTERILFGTLLANGNANRTALAYAGDPGKERDMLQLNRSVTEGRYIEGAGETILGMKLAADLGLGLGDELKVLTTGADYGLHLKKFRIVGLFTSGLKQLDESVFQVPLKDAQSLLRTEGGSQQILVMLKDYKDAGRDASLIEQALAGSGLGKDLVVKPWTAIGEYPRLIHMMEVIYDWMYYVIAFLGAFIITNILMMVVLERRREIGIMKSLGLKRGEILRLFLSEGLMMGVIGSAAGALLGLLICSILSVVGLDFTSAMESMTMPMDGVMYPKADILSALKMFVIGILVSGIVSLLPSRRAARMNAVDAIKSAV